ncbi:hypothetical protein GWI33_018694 [Rhynchophorus ferrugineus]|uniref:Uncharacterized protein n=1 Tax=Rhynchophorus ferrugineus TaxID=354439 RepID=A0A834HXB9_RHYFE|nr:hypothetical protein GWI33_018694 [Rhynchophorus ferrugineus]
MERIPSSSARPPAYEIRERGSSLRMRRPHSHSTERCASGHAFHRLSTSVLFNYESAFFSKEMPPPPTKTTIAAPAHNGPYAR